MTNNDDAVEGLEPNPLVSRLQDAKADGSAIMVLGFTGTSDRNDYVRIFTTLTDMSQSIEIARADIISVATLPNSELGRVAIWVSPDAELHHHIVEKAESYSSRTRGCLRDANSAGVAGLEDVTRAGLRMKVKAVNRDVCTCYYYCDGTRCVPCTC